MRGPSRSLFQGSVDDEVYSGPNRRHDDDRPVLSDEMQSLLGALDKRISSCRKFCVIPHEAHKDVPHLFGAIREIGEGNISRGIDRGRDQHKEVEEVLVSWKDVKKKIMNAVITVIVVGVIGLLATGAYYRLSGSG